MTLTAKLMDNIMNLIRQPNNWTCAAACICMLTGTTLDEFYAYCGHDGSEAVSPSPKHPLGRRCFTSRELYGYLLRHDMTIGFGFKNPEAFDPRKYTITVDLENNPALVDVESTMSGVVHCVLWDGDRIIDPYFPEDKKTPDDYTIIGWWPITKLWPDN